MPASAARSRSVRARTPWVRRSLWMALMLLATLVSPTLEPLSPVQAQEIRSITFPVHRDAVDQVHWSDTWGAARSGGRTHIGVDIMGPKMTPLVAAADGEITWLRHDAGRGNNLEITDDDGWMYHYVHINNDTPGTDDGANEYGFAFAPGIERGARVSAGQIVAFMGDSGNAEHTAPHLHFEIARPDGTPINPTPSVDAAFARLGDLPELDPADLGPYPSLQALLDDVFLTLVGRPATADEIADLVATIEAADLADGLEPFIDRDSVAADVDRLYVAFFLRLPDYGGYQYWIERMSQDLGLVGMADHFAESPEFQVRYGDLTFGDFLDQLYVDVLGRAPDESGKQYWLDRLNDPQDTVTKGTIVAFFTDSPEMRSLAGHRNELVALTALFEDRMPTADEIDSWELLRAGTGLSDAASVTFLN